MARHILGSVIFTAFALAAVGAAHGADPAPPTLKLLKSIPTGAAGKWDFICPDSDARRLYIPRSTHVQIVDLDTGALLGDVPGTNGVHGVALATEQSLGFATSGKDDAVTVFDLKNFKVTQTVKVGKGPDAILFDPASKHILACNHKGGSISVIDPAALDKPPATIEIGGTLEDAKSDNAGHVFVNVEDKNEVVEIDSKANTVLAHWPIEGGDGPTGLAIDPAHHRLYIGCGGNDKCAVLDSTTGKQLALIDAGKGIDGAAFEPTLGVAMIPNGKEGTMTIIKETSEGKFEVIQTVKTVAGAKTINIDSKLHHAILPCMVDDKGTPSFGFIVVGAP